MPKDCFTNHTLIHHQVCKFDDTFHAVDEEQHESLTFAWWAAPILIAINLIPWAALAWATSAWGLELPRALFLITFGVTMFVYYIGYEGTHFLMHKPSLPWIERLRAFQFIKRHHRIHHVRMNRNLNVFIPLADLVLGTLDRTMPAPVPTPAKARQLARRHSQYGRALRSADPQRGRPAPLARKEESGGGT